MNWQRPESIDLQIVFKLYALLAYIASVVARSQDPGWLAIPGTPPIKLGGAILAAAACCAIGLASSDDPKVLRRALLWFAIAHVVVCLAVAAPQIKGQVGTFPERVAFVLMGMALILLFIWTTAETDRAKFKLQTLFDCPCDSPAALRSRYEQQIRAAAQQEERNRLARDLHDSIKQQIFVIQTAAATAQARFDSDADGARQALDQVRSSARDAMSEMQAMLEQMAAAALENTGLVEAVKKQCEALGLRTGANVDFKLGALPDSDLLPPGAQEALLRFAQEALANIGRHARAAHVTVSLGIATGRLRLEVADDGAGFDPERAPRGQGIANMRARAQEFGGAFELSAAPGRGTSVAVSLPFQIIEPAREYRAHALTMAATLAISLGLVLWVHSLGLVVVTGIAAIGTARYVAAWRRALERERKAAR